MISDKDLDKFVEEELGKDITQENTVDKTVDQQLGEMGWLFDSSRKKLEKDRICYKCKKDVDFTKTPLQILEASKVEKGVWAIVSICSDCYNKLKTEKFK